MNNTPLAAAALETRLDEMLDPVLSSRRTAATLAHALAELGRAQQDFALKWVDIIAKTNAEMAYQFCARAPEAFQLMSLAAVEDWIIRAMDVYDKQGLYHGCSVFTQVQNFAAEIADATHSETLEAVSGVLELFVRGLSGRGLRLEAGDAAYTDTDVLYLPARLSGFARRQNNYRLYKALTAHAWAQTWYGSFRLPEGEALSAHFAVFPDPDKAQRLFHALETARLDACLARDLPGLYRDMQALQTLAGGWQAPTSWTLALKRLQKTGAGVRDSLTLMTELYADELPAPRCYQGSLFVERVEKTLHERLAREKNALREALTHLGKKTPGKTAAENTASRFKVERKPDTTQPSGFRFTLTLDGQPVAPPADVRTLMDSILQDLGQIPDEYLVAASDGGYRRANADAKRPEDVWKGAYHEEGAFLYNEWDHRRAHYRKHWCVLRELDAHPLHEPFVQCTLAKYAGVLPALRKTFEALRGENRLLKKQPYGDDVDFDALVEATADHRAGRELSERLFVKRHRFERDIAVLFMVDMSGSTKGWINDAERESLVLLCEALEILGDRYAIYGFSGMTRKRCELYRIKRFDELYRDDVKARIAGIQPQDYTRMGVAVRHLTKLLEDVEARTKLLITLSDGKPDDYDGYRGDYGIEDTRMSLIEAKRAGIHPFCITIDEAARDYLPHMYGAVNWALVANVRKLPLKVSDIYRRLTL
jgi:nitric oxide reductase NorD protein